MLVTCVPCFFSSKLIVGKIVSSFSGKSYLSGELSVDTRTVTTPMELHVQLHSTYGTPFDDPSRYRHIVGSLVHLTITRPDVAHVFHSLSQFISTPTSVHYSHLLRVLRYLRDTITCCQFSSSSQFQLNAYTDYTWASDPVDR